MFECDNISNLLLIGLLDDGCLGALALVMTSNEDSRVRGKYEFGPSLALPGGGGGGGGWGGGGWGGHADSRGSLSL